MRAAESGPAKLFTAEELAKGFVEAVADEPVKAASVTSASASEEAVSPQLRSALDEALTIARECTDDCGIEVC